MRHFALPKVFMSDLDDTLIHSYQAPAEEMLTALRALMQRIPVAIVSGASFPRIQKLMLDHLVEHIAQHELYVFPNAATQCYLHKNETWEKQYSFDLAETEKALIQSAFIEAIAEAGLSDECNPDTTVFVRDTKVSFVGMNSEVSQELKMAWDPERTKRVALMRALEKRLPDFQVCIGGPITLDVTKKGVNKAYGVEWLSKRLSVPPSDMLFLGDAFYEGGNDAAVIPTGIATYQVSGPDETLAIITQMLSHV